MHIGLRKCVCAIQNTLLHPLNPATAKTNFTYRQALPQHLPNTQNSPHPGTNKSHSGTKRFNPAFVDDLSAIINHYLGHKMTQ
jgi:hypothetical protein